MAVKIRLARRGSKKRPFYRIVVSDSGSPRDGRFIEIVGTYDPACNPAKVEFDAAKVTGWLRKGAVATDTVRSLIKKAGIAVTGTEAAQTPLA